MLKFSIRSIITIVLLLVCVYLLLDQPAILIINIVEGLPAGTLIAWTGIFCLTLVINDLTSANVRNGHMLYNVYRRLLNINLIFAMLWGLLGYYMAGNWSLIFFEKPDESIIFWYYTVVITALPMLILVVYVIHRFIDSLKN